MDELNAWLTENYTRMLRSVVRCARGNDTAAADALQAAAIQAHAEGWLAPTDECRARLVSRACGTVRSAYRQSRRREELLRERPDTPEAKVHPCEEIAEALQPYSDCLRTLARPHLLAYFNRLRNYNERHVNETRDGIPDACAHVMLPYGVTDADIAAWRQNTSDNTRAAHLLRARQHVENCLIRRFGGDWERVVLDRS